MNVAHRASRWEVRGFYNEHGHYPGQMACHTWHKAEVSRDMEIAAFRSRRDIGVIEVREPNGYWKKV